eukprot:gene8608-11632_t
MSDYLKTDDSDSENQNVNQLTEDQPSLTEDQLKQIQDRCLELKAVGNDFFSKANYEEALLKYSEAVKELKLASLPKDPLILLNRCATYLALKRYVPALNDANQAIEIDPTNWKGYWRKGVALMAMSQRKFRTKQAIEAFQSCLVCETLPTGKRDEVTTELNKAQQRLANQDEATPPADLSNCMPS